MRGPASPSHRPRRRRDRRSARKILASCWNWKRLAIAKTINESGDQTGGEAGIRTLGTTFGSYNGLANRRLQPLGHLTALRTLSIRETLTCGRQADVLPVGAIHGRRNPEGRWREEDPMSAHALVFAGPHPAWRFSIRPIAAPTRGSADEVATMAFEPMRSATQRRAAVCRHRRTAP